MDPETDNSKLGKALAAINGRVSVKPQIALVLGSGLGDFADELSDRISIPTSTIPYYPVSTVQGHAGDLVFGRVLRDNQPSLPLLVFKGRVHYYESGDLDTALFPIHIAKGLGARYLIATNAAGGINKRFSPGDLMLIRDFMNFAYLRIPLSREEEKEVLPPSLPRPIPSSRDLLDDSLQLIIKQCAEKLKIKLQEGVYCWLQGPSYETKAEIQMFGKFGADAVGMSTVPEMILAHHLGMKLAGISLISNLAAGLSGEKLSHQEVTDTANRVKKQFSALLKDVLLNI